MMNRKNLATILTTIMTLSLVGCGGTKETPTDEKVNTNIENSVDTSTSIKKEKSVNTSTSINEENKVDTNTSTYTSTNPTEADSRIGKTLGELMDLSAYLEECKTLDVYRDSARELSDVLPFEIYEFFNDELINYYADGTGTKTVKAASIEGLYGSVMVIKMDGSETFDIIMRATSDKYEAYDSCTYASLVDFEVIQTNLTKEEVENMLYDNGILKEEYNHLLQGSAEVSTTGQTLNDYIANQNNQPKYFVLNPYDSYYEELFEFTTTYLLETPIALVYFGTYPMPIPGDEVVIVRTYFDEETLSYQSLDEVIETINNYNINEIITLSDEAGLKSLANKYSAKDVQTSLTSLEAGKTLDEQVDLTAYNEIVEELEATSDYSRELKDILPFEIYSVEYDGLYNVNDYTGDSHSVISGSIPGEMDSVMVIRMDDVTNYNILLRFPNNANDIYGSCSFDDLGNYRVLATDLTKEEVEKMVVPGNYLAPDYEHLRYETSNTYNGEESLGDLILRKMCEPKYLVFNYSNIAYEELTEENKYLLLETPIAYAYFGSNPMPKANEDVSYVETFFNENIYDMSLEEVIEVIKSYPLLGTNPLVKNPYDTNAY